MRQRLDELKSTREIPLFGGPWYCTALNPGVVLVNMSRTQANMTDNREATCAECTLREDVHYLTGLLCEHHPAFRNAYLLTSATQVGVRETRRIKGTHTLTGEEYLSALKFHDAVTRGCHPIDIHRAADTGQRCDYLEEAAYIPYRSLTVVNFPNLLVAGRCLSADEVSSASARVQATCMGMGQAAGTAAALCAAGGIAVNGVDADKLRELLIASGAVI